MEELERWVKHMADSLLVSATCGVEGGLVVDPSRAADHIFELATFVEKDLTMVQLQDVVQMVLNKVITRGEALGAVLLSSRQLVHDGGRGHAVVAERVAAARELQLKELTHHIMLHMADVYEATRRNEPIDEAVGGGGVGGARRTPRATSLYPSWWSNPIPPPNRADIDVKCYGFIGLNAIVSCDIVDVNNTTNSFRLDAMGMCYLVEGEWMGFVEEVTLNLDTTRRMLYIYTEGCGDQYIVKKKAAGWKDVSRLLRQLATVASCSGVDIHVEDSEQGPVLHWILTSTERSEVGHAVSVWYSAADAEAEGWYPGTVENFSTTTGKYTVFFDTGERAENVHPASMSCLARTPLIGHFWSAASPLWREPRQVLLQGLVRWMARALHRQWGEEGYPTDKLAAPFFPAFFNTLLSGERAEYLQLCLQLYENDEKALWGDLLSVVLKVGLVCVTCNRLFKGLSDFVEFSTHVAVLTQADPNQLAEEPIREVNKVLSYIAAASPPCPPLPSVLPKIDPADGSLDADSLAAFTSALMEGEG